MTKKLAGSRWNAPILQPISVTSPPNPIVPMPSLFASRMIFASSSASSGLGLISSSVRNSCCFAKAYPEAAVAADGHAERADAASMSLRLVHGVHDALADAVNVPVGPAELRELDREGILDVLVLASAPLQDESDLNLFVLPLFEMHDRRPFAEIVPAVFPGEGIDGVRSQVTLGRRLDDGIPDVAFHHDLIRPDRGLDLERRHAGVLADRGSRIACHVDVQGDGVEGEGGLGPGIFNLHRRFDRPPDIGREIGGRLGDQRKNALFEIVHSSSVEPAALAVSTGRSGDAGGSDLNSRVDWPLGIRDRILDARLLESA